MFFGESFFVICMISRFYKRFDPRFDLHNSPFRPSSFPSGLFIFLRYFNLADFAKNGIRKPKQLRHIFQKKYPLTKVCFPFERFLFLCFWSCLRFAKFVGVLFCVWTDKSYETLSLFVFVDVFFFVSSCRFTKFLGDFHCVRFVWFL